MQHQVAQRCLKTDGFDEGGEPGYRIDAMDEPVPRAARFANAVRDFFSGLTALPYERHVRRERAELNELFMLLCFLEAAGVPNPATLYVLEFYPVLLEEWHRWHRSLGMDRSPIGHMRCC